MTQDVDPIDDAKSIPEENLPSNLESPEQVIDEIVTRLDNLQKDVSQAATEIGYARERIKSIRPSWMKFANTALNNPEDVKVYATGVNTLVAFRDELRSRESSTAPLLGLVRGISSGSYGAVVTTSSTGSIVSSSSIVDFTQPDYLYPTAKQDSDYVQRLSKLSPALGETYQAVRETQFGTRADPERGALYLIRQSFDHLFDILSPDETVRKSKYWKKKTGDKPDMVTRSERIHYAVATHVKDQAVANRLATSSKHMEAVYQSLNTAHKRGELNQTKAQNALAEMRVVLEQWMDALEL